MIIWTAGASSKRAIANQATESHIRASRDCTARSKERIVYVMRKIDAQVTERLAITMALQIAQDECAQAIRS